MGHILSHPVQSKLVTRKGDHHLRAGCAEMQGYRINMEDTHAMELDLRACNNHNNGNTNNHNSHASHKHTTQATSKDTGTGTDTGPDCNTNESSAGASSDSMSTSTSTSTNPASTTSASHLNPNQNHNSSSSSSPDGKYAFFGVYDGHSGNSASIFLAQHLHSRIAQLPDPGSESALKECVMQVDADFMSDVAVRTHGSTACFAIIHTLPQPSATTPTPTPTPDTRTQPPHSASSSSSSISISSSGSCVGYRYVCTIGNVGDSRAMLINLSTGGCRTLTHDHKPDEAAEARRIRNAGGKVSFGRVDGELAMSRSIGDWNYKGNDSLPAYEQKVISEPDITVVDVLPDEALLLCCDGLVEKLTNEQIAQFVAQHIKQQPTDPAGVMCLLLDHSLLRGSKDNMSAMLILFQDGSDYNQPDEFIAGTFTDGEDDKKFVEAYKADAKRHGYEGQQLMNMAREASKKYQTQTQAQAQAQPQPQQPHQPHQPHEPQPQAQ